MARPEQLSEEFVRESDESEAAESSEDESDDTGDDTAKPQNTSKKATVSAVSGKSDSDGISSESTSRENSTEASAAEQSDSASRKRQREELATPARKSSPKRQKRSTRKIPAQPFIAPIGFQSLDSASTPADARILDELNDTDGKQVWHIAAPASLDLSTIKQIDISAVLAGGPVLTSHGISYGMQPVTERSELFLPQSDPAVYKAPKAKVSKSFQLRQIASKPEVLVADSQPETDRPPQTSRTVREQPVGKLNYQFLPFGVKTKVASASKDSAGAAEPVQLKTGASPSTPGRREKKSKRPKLVDTV
ncbi:uncharacterized protein AB675_8792 [Cyphellophora attinorum]|uniref:Uncharacterized protein n=1 Tax=Cyphellophora attinorum TaxID=1664694 RepID=A0A0N1HGB4_9EURO|nr:uncharacterized protein AB675_8792 [Phialophora attinorum]KPI44562.1 hypothetical protein AB675_8792 [Phialophora attinorum]